MQNCVKSRYRGVYRCGKRWKAQLQSQGIQFYLGTFDSEEEAAKAYDRKAREEKGGKSQTNFDETGAETVLCHTSYRSSNSPNMLYSQSQALESFGPDASEPAGTGRGEHSQIRMLWDRYWQISQRLIFAKASANRTMECVSSSGDDDAQLNYLHREIRMLKSAREQLEDSLIRVLSVAEDASPLPHSNDNGTHGTNGSVAASLFEASQSSRAAKDRYSLMHDEESLRSASHVLTGLLMPTASAADSHQLSFEPFPERKRLREAQGEDASAKNDSVCAMHDSAAVISTASSDTGSAPSQNSFDGVPVASSVHYYPMPYYYPLPNYSLANAFNGNSLNPVAFNGNSVNLSASLLPAGFQSGSFPNFIAAAANKANEDLASGFNAYLPSVAGSGPSMLPFIGAGTGIGTGVVNDGAMPKNPRAGAAVASMDAVHAANQQPAPASASKTAQASASHSFDFLLQTASAMHSSTD